MESIVQFAGRIALKGLQVRFGQSGDFVPVREDAPGEDVVPPGGSTAERSHFLLEIRRLEFLGHILVECIDEGSETLLIDGTVVVLEERRHHWPDRPSAFQVVLDIGCKMKDLYAADGFVEILICKIAGLPPLIDRLDAGSQAFVLRAFRPGIETALEVLLGLHRAEPGYTFRFALPFLPGVGGGGVL